MPTRLLSIALAAWNCCAALAAAAPGQDTASLDAGRGTYEREKQAIENALRDSGKAASAAYLTDLQSVVRHMEQAGDEFGVRPAKAEIQRFEQSRTMPRNSDVGTPELIRKARARYDESLAKAESDAAAKREALNARYLRYLKGLKDQLEAASKTAEASKVAMELDRIAPGGGAAMVGNIALPKELLNQLRLFYNFEGGSGRQVMDQSTRRQHGDLTGSTRGKDAGEGSTCTFFDSYDMLETKEIRIGSSWTVSVRALFPIADKKEPRVLVSSAHGKHHVLADATGVLGIQPKDFAGCGLNVNALRGWHEITVACSWGGTFFFLDGKPAGAAKTGGPFSGPLNAIGNSAAGGCPWSGTISSVMLWTRCLSTQEIAELCKLTAGQ